MQSGLRLGEISARLLDRISVDRGTTFMLGDQNVVQRQEMLRTMESVQSYNVLSPVVKGETVCRIIVNFNVRIVYVTKSTLKA